MMKPEELQERLAEFLGSEQEPSDEQIVKMTLTLAGELFHRIDSACDSLQRIADTCCARPPRNDFGV